ncbi:MAG TPA: hypothetical protein VFD38_18340 [Myxococcaceae bacterium]|nr:hypothetical protein [Myxococcaceae bacterium]
MRAGYYLLTFVLGLFGVLAALRAVERLLVGQWEMMTFQQALIGAVCLYFAWWSLRRARVARTRAGSAPPGGGR